MEGKKQQRFERVVASRAPHSVVVLKEDRSSSPDAQKLQESPEVSWCLQYLIK